MFIQKRKVKKSTKPNPLLVSWVNKTLRELCFWKLVIGLALTMAGLIALWLTWGAWFVVMTRCWRAGLISWGSGPVWTAWGLTIVAYLILSNRLISLNPADFYSREPVHVTPRMFAWSLGMNRFSGGLATHPGSIIPLLHTIGACLFIGPFLAEQAIVLLYQAYALKTADLMAVSRALTVLFRAGERVSLEALSASNPGVPPARWFPPLTQIHGVICRPTAPIGLALSDELVDTLGNLGDDE